MKNAYVMPLADNLATLETVGGKGMSLAKLVNAQIPVPDGFHVTTDAYRLFVAVNGIGPKIMEALAQIDPENKESLERVSRSLRETFEAGTIPHELEKSIAAAYKTMKGVPVAVRSSATTEDLPEASFAGQQDTYLNIREEADVLDAIRRCWASLWTARAISYRQLHNIDQELVALAVVVQKLVFSDVSGVMFTANPVNGRRSEIVINAAWGLGEAVVSSLVNPDTAVVDKDTGRIVSLDIADKQVMTVRIAGGSREEPVATGMRKKPALTRKEIISLAGLGRQIEAFYGMPMDVEWALEQGTVYIVQARPITVLPPEWKAPEKGIYYTKGSLAEHLPGPVTPLFATQGLRHVNRAAKSLWVHMFGKSVPRLWPGHGAYTVINGYVYLSCAYKPLLLMVKSLSPRSLREGMMNSVPRYEAAQTVFADVVDQGEGIRPKQLSADELLNQAGHFFDDACTYFTKIQLCLPSAMTSETFFRILFQKRAGRCGIPDLSVLLCGFDTVALNAEKSLFGIAEWIKQHDEMKAYITQTPTKEIGRDLDLAVSPERIQPVLWQEWKDRIRLHLYRYGRTCYEYDFAKPTPREEYLPALETVRIFAAGEGKSPFIRQAEAIQRRIAAETVLRKHLGGVRRRLFDKLLHWARKTGVMREDAIYYMGMAHPLIRRMFGELGCRLTAGGALSRPEDIYWLEQQELEELVRKLDQDVSLPDMTGVILPRKEVFEDSCRLISPETLPEKARSLQKKVKPVRKDGKLVLTGIGTSTGVVTAPACLLYGPADFDRFRPGDVLVAVTTTPAWTPLFAMAGAVVTDIGGPLSHSSIVAREYGIPAVMAVHSATQRIRNGQMVTVDGGIGTVVLDE